jgi:putative DNA primase/helicase
LPIEITESSQISSLENLMRQTGGFKALQGTQIIDEQPDLLFHPNNDHGNACRLIALFGADLRYCHAHKKWHVWDGARWAIDDTDQARRRAKETMIAFCQQAIYKHAGERIEKFASSSLDTRRISSMLSMAECEIFVRPNDLDVSPDLLNFRNGTVDLRTGELRPHDRNDLITKMIRHNYSPSATCPQWIEFLNGIMGGGAKANVHDAQRAVRLTNYLQRAFGYSLTAHTVEKAVFVLFGQGNNGKSTMLSTFRRIADEYSMLLQVDTLMVRQESNNTQADLADLRGARFVQTSETEDGQRLAQGKLKRITQGMGKIKAIRKYENPIEFNETHKLWMDTNRKPEIQDADDRATFNRLHPIPFAVTIPEEQIDRELPDKLYGEAEGILAWAVAGAREWDQVGLQKPPEVEQATQSWKSDMDQIGRFCAERCLKGPELRATSSSLYTDYRNWAQAAGERKILSQKALGLNLGNREGIRGDHANVGTVYSGITLRYDRDPDAGE